MDNKAFQQAISTLESKTDSTVEQIWEDLASLPPQQRRAELIKAYVKLLATSTSGAAELADKFIASQGQQFTELEPEPQHDDVAGDSIEPDVAAAVDEQLNSDGDKVGAVKLLVSGWVAGRAIRIVAGAIKRAELRVVPVLSSDACS